jgi:signal peptidase I
MPETDPGTSEPQQAAARPGRRALGEPVSAPAVPDDGAPVEPVSAPAGQGDLDAAPADQADLSAPKDQEEPRAVRSTDAATHRSNAAPAAEGGATAPHGERPRSGARPARSDGKEPAPARNPFAVWLKEIATVVIIAVVLSFLIKTFLFRAFYIPSESMVSTLDVNDRIFVNLLVPEPFALERGDVVVFKDTKGWLPPSPQKVEGPFTWVEDGLTFVGLLPDNSEQHLVKRVIGLPGDHVLCCDADGKVTVNGAPLDEKYINPAEVPLVRNFDVVVPAGKVWVMGDNRNHSADSRAHTDSNGGFVDIPDIEGRAAVIAWPLNRWSGLDNYPDVFKSVPSAG